MDQRARYGWGPPGRDVVDAGQDRGADIGSASPARLGTDWAGTSGWTVV